MTIATYVTLLRLLAAVAILPFIYQRTAVGYGIAAAIFICAIASDIVDGFIARNFNQITQLGAKLDPLVDKILIYTALFGLLQVNAIEPVLVFSMFIRDMIVDGLRNEAAEASRVLGANVWGKAKFSFQALSIMCSLGFCITGRGEFVASANTSLLVALVVSLPGLVVIASALDRNSQTEGAEDNPSLAKATLMSRSF